MARYFNSAVLKTATEAFPRVARKDYKPYWTEELQELENTVSQAREVAEKKPSVENNIALKEATAKYRMTCTETARESCKKTPRG